MYHYIDLRPRPNLAKVAAGMWSFSINVVVMERSVEAWWDRGQVAVTYDHLAEMIQAVFTVHYPVDWAIYRVGFWVVWILKMVLCIRGVRMHPKAYYKRIKLHRGMELKPCDCGKARPKTDQILPSEILLSGADMKVRANMQLIASNRPRKTLSCHKPLRRCDSR